MIGPKGATYRDPRTGVDISNKDSWIADVIVDRTIPGYGHWAKAYERRTLTKAATTHR